MEKERREVVESMNRRWERKAKEREKTIETLSAENKTLQDTNSDLDANLVQANLELTFLK